MKKYLFLAIALLSLASCAKDDLADGNKPIHGGEIEESYIAINLSASDITRAQTGFDDGTAEERAVNHADFFFFDEAGNPFNVTGNPATTPGGGINHLKATNVTFTKDSETTDDDDISDTSTPVLLLKTYKGQYPSQIVAVLNWSPDDKESYSLGELHAAVNITGVFDSKDYFVMSNAVYAQGTTPVYATPLTMENIKTTEEAALGAPVNIYVERVAAKVKLNANPKYDLSANVQYQPLGQQSKIEGGVYAKILGWDLYRDNSQSKLLKEIDGTWTTAAIGFNWNDEPWYRSYWAKSLDAPTNDPVYGDTPLAVNTSTYIGENTTGKTTDGETYTNTKAVIKAQLVTTVDGVDKTLELAKWNNVEYVDEVAADQQKGGESLRIAVANTLKYTYFYKDGDNFIGLKPEDLQCVAGATPGAPDHVLANEVYFQLSTADKVGENRVSGWYKLVGGVYTPMSDNLNSDDPKGAKALNNALKSVPEAVLYKNGETFYYVDIEHLGQKGTDAEYGIVRNHVYNITINSIKGYGSPVYTGVSYLEYPQITEQQTYVSAKINILSWKLVNQSVDIKPNN